MTFEPTSHLLAIVLPMSFKKGKVTFCPTTTGEDIQVPIPLSEHPRHVVSTAQLSKGRWRALLDWSDGKQQYLKEQEILVV